MFTLMPTAISCSSVDPSSSVSSSDVELCQGEVAGAGHACALVSRGKAQKVGQETVGCFSKEHWKGSITWSATRTPTVFVLIRAPLVIHYTELESVIKHIAKR